MLKNILGTQWQSWIVKWGPRQWWNGRESEKERERMEREKQTQSEEEEEMNSCFKDLFSSIKIKRNELFC